MITIYVITILIIIFILKPIHKYVKQKSIYSCFKIPEKGYVPLLGHFFSLCGQVSKQDHFRNLIQLSHQCPNESVFCIWFLLYPAIIIKKVDYLESFLVANSKQINKAQDYALLDDWLKTGLLISGGKKWRTRRRIITPSFHDNNLLANCIDTFNEQLDICLKRFQILADEANENNLYPFISAWTLDVICETAMGKSVGAQNEESEYVKAVIQITDIIALRMRSPWLWPRPLFKLSALGRKHDKLLKIIHKFTRQVIEDRIANFSFIKTPSRMAFLDTLVSKMQEEQLSLEDVQEEVDTFMFEGHDTTATALNFALFMIALHQDVQQRLFEEMQSIFKDDNKRACTLDDVRQMEYLECVIKETLRLLPSVPLIGREIQEDFQYNGKTFLKGTTVLMFIYEIHRDPQHFPNPEKFDPDRFLPELVQQRHPYAYIPFSAGARNCIGQRFALLEEKVFLSSIIRQFHLTTNQTYNDLIPVYEIILRSYKELKIKLSLLLLGLFIDNKVDGRAVEKRRYPAPHRNLKATHLGDRKKRDLDDDDSVEDEVVRGDEEFAPVENVEERAVENNDEEFAPVENVEERAVENNDEEFAPVENVQEREIDDELEKRSLGVNDEDFASFEEIKSD